MIAKIGSVRLQNVPPAQAAGLKEDKTYGKLLPAALHWGMDLTEAPVFDHIAPYYQPASVGRRFVNYIVDMLVFYLFFFAVVFILGIIVEITSGSANDLGIFLDSLPGTIVSSLFAVALMLLIYTAIEGLSGGRSLGKLITGTVAIREDGSPITWKDAFMRSLCRVIPFEPLTGFGGHPWHDTMTKTVVVRK